jgi:hypothetical protein
MRSGRATPKLNAEINVLPAKNPAACEIFCDCIYGQGQLLDSCLATFNNAKDIRRSDKK